MRYSSVRSMDVSNGEYTGVSLFTQGCPFHCKNCFNPETWSFEDGKEWTLEKQAKFLTLLERPFIKRVSILGGEPLCNQNVQGVLDLVKSINFNFPELKIWLYTGFTVSDILYRADWEHESYDMIRFEVLTYCDIVVDGPYMDNLHDYSLLWKGSSNQRVINMDETLRKYTNSGILLTPRPKKEDIVNIIDTKIISLYA